MILLMGHIDFDPDATGAFTPAVHRQVAESRKEDGCIAYALAFDPLVPGRLVVAEAWRDAAALDAHANSAHMALWRQAIEEIGGARRQLTRYEVADDAATPL